MRSVACALLGLLVASTGVTPVSAQAWLTVGDADGRFRVDMPVPFDLPPSEIEPDGTFTFSYVHETPDLALRLEVIDGAPRPGEALQAHATRVSRLSDGGRVLQMRVHVVDRRIYRLVAISTPELEGDAMILRFLDSIRLPP
jgi:hypothetical protein